MLGSIEVGLGLTREVTFLVESSGRAIPMGTKIKPYGIFGGEGGGTDSGGVILSDGKIVTVSGEIEPGNKPFIQTSGGGGWGDPLERDIEKVEWDALNGYISLKSAKGKYGCVLDPKTYKADLEKTKELRDKIRTSRLAKKIIKEVSKWKLNDCHSLLLDNLGDMLKVLALLGLRD